MSRSGVEYLRHIQEEITYLLTTVKPLGREGFLADETLKRAAVRSLSVMGEAAKKVPEEITSAFEGVPWSRMAAMRDKLVHDYFGVDYEIVWDVIANELPQLNQQTEEMLDQLG